MIEDYKAVLEGFLQLQSPEARQSPGIESDEGQAEASMRGPILEQWNESVEDSPEVEQKSSYREDDPGERIRLEKIKESFREVEIGAGVRELVKMDKELTIGLST